MTSNIIPFSLRKTDPDYTDAPYHALPFVRQHAHGGIWSPPPCDDYQAACIEGRRYAAHFAQFLKDNPLLPGGSTLGDIACAIDYTDSCRRGYWSGFFAYLELLIADGVRNRPVFADWRAFETSTAQSWARESAMDLTCCAP